MPNEIALYPKIFIHSKNYLTKRLVSSNYTFNQILADINEVISNFNHYWYDSKESDPVKKKFVRSAQGTKLGKLLKLIDSRVLAKHDNILPPYIFGGISGKNHIQAARYLLGKQKQRTLLALDISRFFEQTNEQRVYHFFHNKAQCSVKGAELLASLCCVEEGPKNCKSGNNVLARGFATSPRLAIWCNLGIFIKLSRLVRKRLKIYDPRLAIFVDDIGITASRVPRETMEKLRDEIIQILNTSDPNQSLPANSQKTRICSYEEGIEHLGLKLGRNTLSFGKKTLSRRARILHKLKMAQSIIEKRQLILKKKSYIIYGNQIKK